MPGLLLTKLVVRRQPRALHHGGVHVNRAARRQRLQVLGAHVYECLQHAALVLQHAALRLQRRQLGSHLLHRRRHGRNLLLLLHVRTCAPGGTASASNVQMVGDDT